LPRGVTGAFNQQQQQQQQQQFDAPATQELGQQQWQQQGLADKNRSFSGALRQLQGLEELLNLLESPQWGRCLCDLDGVSVVGALVVFVRSSDWQQLQQQSAGTQQQQQQRRQLQQRGERAIQVGRWDGLSVTLLCLASSVRGVLHLVLCGANARTVRSLGVLLHMFCAVHAHAALLASPAPCCQLLSRSSMLLIHAALYLLCISLCHS
jgi:hypothetical protein